jgi:hypothetical protein
MEPRLGPRDVFVSYSSKDRALMRAKLQAPLEAAGLDVVVDTSDFVFGATPLENMRVAIQNSRHTVLAITSNWIQSEWCAYESLFTEHLDVAAKRRKLIPVRLDETKPPSELLRTYCDLSGGDYPANLARLIEQLRERDGEQVVSGASPPPLVSDLIYHRLREHLSLRHWREADAETRRILCDAVGVSPIVGLRLPDFERLPLTTLEAVDSYWRQASSGRFGLAVQRRIFDECRRDWECFGKRVGWIRNSLWIAYSDVWDHVATGNMRDGELPIGGRGGVWGGIGDATLGQGFKGVIRCQYKILESAAGDLAHTGGFSRVGQRFVEDLTLNNGFALAWMKPRELLLERWAKARAEAGLSS